MNRFILLLASNLNAEFQIHEACDYLAKSFPLGIRFSENHWSDAVIKSGQSAPTGECARYLNTVCMGITDVTLDDFQAFLKKKETDMGRDRGKKTFGCVAIDMDLVEWNGDILRPKDAAQDYYRVCLKDLLLK